jgi:hypothetical protein
MPSAYAGAVGKLTILSPIAAPRIDERELTKRPGDLRGLTIGLLDNQKANAGKLLAGVSRRLASRYPDLKLVTEYKVATSPCPEEVMGRLQRCDAVVLAISD